MDETKRSELHAALNRVEHHLKHGQPETAQRETLVALRLIVKHLEAQAK